MRMRRESLLIAIGVAVLAWGSLLWFKFSGDASKGTQEAVVVVAPPSESSETANATGALPPAGGPALPSESEPIDDGKSEVMVTTRLTSIYGSPSASAPVLYAFPAGRQLRVFGGEGGFARIKDLQSGATGWVETSTLAPGSGAAPRTPTALSTPSAPTEPSAGGGNAAPGSGPAGATKPPATQRAATQPPAAKKTATQRAASPPPPGAEADAAKTAAQKQAAKRAAQRAERQGPFPDFLKRAFGSR